MKLHLTIHRQEGFRFLEVEEDGGAVEEGPEVIRRYRVGRGVGRSDRTIPAPFMMIVLHPDDQIPLTGVCGGVFFVLLYV